MLTIHRDIRDILISRLFFRRHRHAVGLGSEPADDREYINAAIQGRIGGFKLGNHINTWRVYNDGFLAQNYKAVHYEDLTADPVGQIREISEFLDCKINKGKVRDIALKTSFGEQAQREPGDEKRNGFLRKGIVGDWKNWLDEESVRIIGNEIDSPDCRI